MRVLQRAVAVLHPLGGCIVLTREVSGKKNERNIPAILISVSRRQAGKRLKKSRRTKDVRRDWNQSLETTPTVALVEHDADADQKDSDSLLEPWLWPPVEPVSCLKRQQVSSQWASRLA